MTIRVNIETVHGGAGGRSRRRSFGSGSADRQVTILNGFGRDFRAYQKSGAFSLKWIPRGTARYEVDGVRHHLSGDRVLMLYPGQPYEVAFQDRRGTESLCLFVSDALIEHLRTDIRESGGDPPGGLMGRPGHPRLDRDADMVFRAPAATIGALNGLRHGLTRLADHPERLEEIALSLCDDLLCTSLDHRRLAARVPARRPRTRRALLGRLQRAREMIEDSPSDPPHLDVLARESGVSKYHLLRLFKATFGTAPWQYAQRRRVARGRLLLRDTNLPVGEIAARLGYESQSAFARAFRRHMGVAPGAYRDG